MKKLCALVLALSLLTLGAAWCSAEVADALTSASVADFYASAALTGDELMASINSYNGFFAVASVNPDGTPNVGFYIFSCVKLGDDYYLQLGLSPNQTTANVENGSSLMAIYAQAPAEGMSYATAGARMKLEAVTDADLIAELKGVTPEQVIEVTSATARRVFGL